MIFLNVVSLAYADVIPENHHPVDRCAMIADRSAQLPNIKVKGRITGPMLREPRVETIVPDTCLSA